MTREREERLALLTRLEWLRLLGVDALPRGRADAASRREPPLTAVVPGDTARGAAVPGGTIRQRGTGVGARAPAGHAASARPVVQAGLFGGSVEVEGAGTARVRGRDRGAEPAGSPLASVRAPEAPDPAAALRLIREEIGDCTRCGLCRKRTHIVFGVGSASARLMFVGEGPGADEDLKGEPFVGRAGQLLTKIIESMGLKREEVYIANVVKCRPPENRTPLPDEIGTCSPFLFQQVQAIRPRVLVCLGTPAAQTVLGTRETITRLRGSFHDQDGIRIMPTFHPAYLLRNPAAKREVWDDMKKVMAELKASG